MLLDLVSYFDTAPGSSGGAAAAVSGDSLTVKNAISGTPIDIVALWGKNQTSGWQQIIYPSGNDTTRNIREVVVAAQPSNLLGRGIKTPLVESETMTITIAGSGTAGDLEIGQMLVRYKDLPGQSGRYIGHDELMARAVRLVTVQVSLTMTGAGAYEGSEALNDESDLLKPNTDYALIGGVTRVLCASFNLKGPDNANGRVGIPGSIANPQMTAGFFADLARHHGEPLIPVINSDNKASTLLDGLQDENAANIVCSYNLVQLAPGGGF